MNYYFECYYHCFGNGTCNKHCGERCEKKCKDFITEDDYFNGLSEEDRRISLAHIREIFELIADAGMIYNIKVDKLMNEIKKQL